MRSASRQRPFGEVTGSSVEGAAGDVIIDDICDWLVEQALSEPSLEMLFEGCSQRVHAAGVPLARAMIGYSTLHPLYRSKTLYWRPGSRAEREGHAHGANMSDGWLSSPLRYMIDNRVSLLRRRLAGDDAMLDFPVLEEFRDAGLTDYLAYVVSFEGPAAAGENPSGLVGSWGTSHPDGFTDSHLRALVRVQRHLAVAMKVRVKDEIAENVLAAYLGPGAGRRVLQGRIRLGDGEKIHAVVWYSDLRDSTRLAQEMNHEDFLGLLNDFFECTAGAVLIHGGEVLRFVGDAVLAIFPLAGPDSAAGHCADALAAVREALQRQRALQRRGRRVEFGIGLHVGDVLYGNIGVPSRVEFTVIGSCANEVARLEDLTKALGQPVLVSRRFADNAPDADLVDLGAHPVKGVAEPLHVLALRDPY